MTGADYEEFVQKVIVKLDCWEHARVLRNHKYPGVRQPGEYEIDIAIESVLSDVLSLRYIFECKNWKRRVGRQVVQRVAQTRDAIAAHKAVIISPIGFTKPAIEVAKAHGIALWIVAHNERLYVVDYCSVGPRSLGYAEYCQLRGEYLHALGFQCCADSNYNLLDFSLANTSSRCQKVDFGGRESSTGSFPRELVCDSHAESTDDPLLNDWSAIVQLVAWTLDVLNDKLLGHLGILGEVERWRNRTHEYLQNWLEGEEAILVATHAVMQGNRAAFFAANQNLREARQLHNIQLVSVAKVVSDWHSPIIEELARLESLNYVGLMGTKHLSETVASPDTEGNRVTFINFAPQEGWAIVAYGPPDGEVKYKFIRDVETGWLYDGEERTETVH